MSNRGIMRDIHDSPKWKEAFAASGTFKGDPRGKLCRCASMGSIHGAKTSVIIQCGPLS